MASNTPRRTRLSQQQITRQRILRSARTLFLADGFSATSLDQIAERAGYTRGAVQSNFADKTALGDAVLNDLSRALGRRVHTVHVRDLNDLVTTTTTLCHIAVTRPGWMRLALSLDAATSHRSGTPSRLHRLGGAIGDLFTRAATDLGLAAPTDSEVTGQLLLTVLFGIVQQHPNPADISPTLMRQLVHTLVTSFTDFSHPVSAAMVPGRDARGEVCR